MLEREFQGGSGEAIRTIAANPEARIECLKAAEFLTAACAPAGDAVVQQELDRLGVLYGVPWDDQTAMAIALMEYFEILSDYPAEAIQKGCADFKRSEASNFGFPRPARLLSFVKPHAERIRMVAYRAKMVAETKVDKPLPRTAEERAADRQKLIDEGVIGPDGKIAPLNFVKTPSPPLRTGETKSQMAERVRRIAAGDDPHLQAMQAAPVQRGAGSSEVLD